MPDRRFQQRRRSLQDFLADDLRPLLAQHPLPELHGKRLLLTGATGFVGSWLLLAIQCLNETGAGIQVTALSRDPQGFLERAPEWTDTPWLSWLQGDIRDFPPPEGPIDAIIHGATDTSARFAREHPEALYASIVHGTEHLLRLAAGKNIRRLLLLSSGAIYGEQPADLAQLPEDYCPNPETTPEPYGEGKRMMEKFALRFAQEHALDLVMARGFTFVGFGLGEHLAISQFIENAQENPFIAVKGDGQAVRSYLYAADMAVWLLTILARGTPQRAYNVGSPHAVTLMETATQVRDRLAPDKRVAILDTDAPAPRRRYVPDTRRAENELGLRAWTPLALAVQRTATSRALARPATE